MLQICLGAHQVQLQLLSAKWLDLLLNYIKPQHFHFDLRIIRQLPQHNLMAHMETDENGRAEVLLDVLTLILLQLDEIYKVALDLAEVIEFCLQVHPLSLVGAQHLQFVFLYASSATYYLELVRCQHDQQVFACLLACS